MTPKISRAEELCKQECRDAINLLDAETKTWLTPAEPSPDDTAGALVAKMLVAGPENPYQQFQTAQKNVRARLKEAERHLDEANNYAFFVLHVANVLDGSRQTIGSCPEPMASYARTLAEGGKAGLVDCKALSKEVYAAHAEARDRIAKIRRETQKYASVARIVLTKAKAAHLKHYPKWSAAIPALEAKAKRLTQAHRQQFPKTLTAGD